MSLRVVHAYLSSALADLANQRQVLNIIEEIVRLAKGPNGAAAKGYGVDFVAGMPLDLIDHEAFQSIRRPRLQKELESVKAPAYLVDDDLKSGAKLPQPGPANG